MKAIVVDDEPIMLSSFARLSKGISDLEITGQFTDAEEALSFFETNRADLAFLDVKLPGMDGIELAERLRAVDPDVLLVFVSAYDEYIRDFNRIGGDYYIVKPYREETLETAMERMRLLAKRRRKRIYIQTFGRFTVLKDGKPICLRGKAKEILALAVTKRGYEVSNEEIYWTLWENRSYSNENMTVYYNALRRLKNELRKAGLEDLLISMKHGQLVNTELFDCDYYDWLDGRDTAFNGEFLSEYSWSEPLLAEMSSRL